VQSTILAPLGGHTCIEAALRRAATMAHLRDPRPELVRVVVGIVSKLEAVGEQPDGAMAATVASTLGARRTRQPIVRDVMEPHPAAVHEDEPMMLAVHELLGHHLGGVPVTDRHGELVGELSEANVLAWQVRTLERFMGAREPDHPDRAPTLDRETVHDAMTRPPISIEETAPVAAAVAMFPTGGIARLLVTHHGRLVGLLTRAAVLRALAGA
jgi:CBS domain-containing protein